MGSGPVRRSIFARRMFMLRSMCFMRTGRLKFGMRCAVRGRTTPFGRDTSGRKFSVRGKASRCMSANHFDLATAAFTEMVSQGFHPDFPNGTEEQVERIRAAVA